MSFSSDEAEIMTTQCEAYEVMKLQKQPSGEQTTSGTAPEQMYEEVGERITSSRQDPQSGTIPPQAQQMVGEGLKSSSWGPQTGATPPQERSTQQMYEEVAGEEELTNQSSTQHRTETSAL